MFKRLVNFLVGMLCVSLSYAQEINQNDAQGARHGQWEKRYEGTKQLRYIGTFDHGKEIGDFKFYSKAGGHPTAIKRYTAGSATLDVIFYTTTGKKVSEGKMNGRSREGTWLYYHNDGSSVLSKETYENDLQEGTRTSYYMSGTKTLEENYIHGKREGLSTQYTEDGTLLKELTYINDELHGPARLYDALGTLIKEGNYKENKKDGLWKYYTDGKLTKEIRFPQNRIGVED